MFCLETVELKLSRLKQWLTNQFLTFEIVYVNMERILHSVDAGYRCCQYIQKDKNSNQNKKYLCFEYLIIDIGRKIILIITWIIEVYAIQTGFNYNFYHL